MGANASNSSADPICPTYASGAWSLMSGTSVGDRLNDCVSVGSPLTGGTVGLGYINQYVSFSVGSTNCDWNNDCLSQNVAPIYSNGLLSFGNTGRQS